MSIEIIIESSHLNKGVGNEAIATIDALKSLTFETI